MASAQLLSQHMFYWKNPVQRLIIVIMCMATIYAIASFFGLAEIKGSEVLFTILESIKECYEALVIVACFLGLLDNCVSISTSSNIIPDGIKGHKIHHNFPVTLFVAYHRRRKQSLTTSC